MAADSDEENHTSLPSQAVIVLCLVGAGAAILCAWAMFRHLGTEKQEPPSQHVVGEDGYNQVQYMRTVRIRNQEELQRIYGFRLPGLGRPKAQPYPYGNALHGEPSMSSF